MAKTKNGVTLHQSDIIICNYLQMIFNNEYHALFFLFFVLDFVGN